MLNEKRWKAVHDFEKAYRKKFLKNLTGKRSLKIFNDLYQFGQQLVDKDYYKRLDHIKIKTLAKVHSSFMKVK